MVRTSVARLVWLLGAAVFLCGAAAFGEEYVFTFAHAQPLTHPRHLSMEFFKTVVETASQGRIKVELFGAGVLGGESELMDMVKLGTI